MTGLLVPLCTKSIWNPLSRKRNDRKTKATIITSVTLLMGLGFCMMFRVPVGQIILAVVWVCHMVYFLFGVKTIKKKILKNNIRMLCNYSWNMWSIKTAKKISTYFK